MGEPEKEYFSEIWETSVVTNASAPTMQVFKPRREIATGTSDDALGLASDSIELFSASHIEGAVEVGVNRVSPLRFTSSKSRDAYRDASEKAVEDARQNAERLADSPGLTLGDAIQVNAGAATRPPGPMRRAAALAMNDAEARTYTAGDLAVTANISVVFERSL